MHNSERDVRRVVKVISPIGRTSCHVERKRGFQAAAAWVQPDPEWAPLVRDRAKGIVTLKHDLPLAVLRQTASLLHDHIGVMTESCGEDRLSVS
jgi:hypothetical protein